MSQSDPAPAGDPGDMSLAERAEARADAVAQRFDKSDWIELVSALLLALATISAAWCAYQSTRWSGVQANAYASAGANRQESVRASSEYGAQVNIDVAVFMAWVQARRAQDADLAGFWEERFRAEFKPAFDAWLDSVPVGQIPPGSPFALAEYAPASRVLAEELERKAEDSAAEAREANQTGDNFVLLAVLFASVLFFAGVGTKFKGYRVRVAMVALASVFYLVTTFLVFSLPQNVGI
ncbi:MAG: hypothetical protein OEV61_03125 [Chloroflexota bacterium]|nr:hypothetical protein [Chloroflexota bacterium]MDH5242866.1 hypothetical protein [Chloroflexota bacterium]